MSVNVDNFVHPDAPSNFTPKEWARANKAIARMRERLAARCRHLIKGEPRGPRCVNWEAVTRERVQAEEKLKAAERAARGDY